jgi:hypothetical protein
MMRALQSPRRTFIGNPPICRLAIRLAAAALIASLAMSFSEAAERQR